MLVVFKLKALAKEGTRTILVVLFLQRDENDKSFVYRELTSFHCISLNGVNTKLTFMVTSLVFPTNAFFKWRIKVQMHQDPFNIRFLEDSE